MSKLLTPLQIDNYHRYGYIAPIRVMPVEQALLLRARLEEYEPVRGVPSRVRLRHKPHLLFAWLGDLVRQEKIVDAVEDLYGGNLLCWTTNFFIKDGNDPAYVSWHQDSTYWGLSKPDVVTAWVALSESNSPTVPWRSFRARTALIRSPQRYLRKTQCAYAWTGGGGRSGSE